MKVTAKLRGGLGNQLFQALAANYFGKKFDAKSYLDDSALRSHRNPSRRSWIRKIDIASFFDNNHLRFENILASKIRKWNPMGNSEPRQLNQAELENLHNPNQNMEIFDWFHTSEYLPLRKIELHDEMFKELDYSVKETSARVKESSEIAAIHIRLGDFQSTPWGVLPSDWYLSALNKFREGTVRTLHCYSDDIAGAKTILEPIADKFSLEFPETVKELSPHNLLWQLAHYRNFVSSNSTLSWWAGYLNVHTDVVIYSAWNEDLHLNNWKRVY